MSNFKFELDSDGVRALLQSPEMAGICESYAREVQSRAGAGYEVSVYTGKNRVNASVKAETAEARRDNFENNTLLKALGGGS